MSTRLTANPRGINELFFSGSQSVEKGEEVEWILDETYAFKITEKCRVSTNASPFVEVNSNDVFIIYKRTDDDRDAKNHKGTYVFDRDTVLGLAYPQETTQDIIIENDIYNNTQNTIIVEAEKTPTAKIELKTSNPTAKSKVSISFASSYAVSPATIKKYTLSMNGKKVHDSSSKSYSFTPSRAGLYDLTLVVTDSAGKKGDASYTIHVKEASAPLPTYTQSVSQEVTYNNPHQKLKYASLSMNSSVSGKISISASVGLLVQYDPAMKDKSYSLPTLYLMVNNSLKKVNQTPVANTNQRITYTISTSYTGSLSRGHKIELWYQDENTGVSYRANYSIAQSPANIQVKVTKRTK